MKACPAIVLCACLTALLAQAPPAGKRSTLRGQVVDGVSGQPLTNVEIDLDDRDWQPAAETVAPDREGRFAFHGLAPGEYILSATRPDLGTVFYDELPDPAYVQTIHLKPGQPEKTVLFRVLPRAVVTGVVRDEFSDPLQGAIVTVYRGVWEDGRVSFQPGPQGVTDDRGRFRVGNLAPGGYFVCAAPITTGGDAAAPSTGPVDFAAQGQARYYSQTCFPDPHAAAPKPLSLLPGRPQEVPLTLRAGSGLSVSGRVLNLPQGVGTGVRLVREGGFNDQQMMFASLGTDGTFTFRGVSPGRYRLDCELIRPPADGDRLVARRSLDVRSSLEDIELRLEPPSFLNVVIHGAPDGVPPERMMVGLRSSAELSWADRDGQGPFRFAPLSPGDYWLLTRTDRHTCVQSAKLGDRDALRGPVTVKPEAALLELSLSSECGGIQARAVADGKPVPDAKVLLLVSGSAKVPGNLLHDFADEEGEAYFDGLRPGRYLLWAWSVDAAGTFLGPENLADVAKKAAEVVVTAGEPVKVDVPVIRPEERP